MIVSASLLAQTPLEQAVNLTRQGRYAEARKLLNGVPEPAELPQRIAFHRLLAAVASGLHEPAKAVAEMKAALALAPADPNLSLALAVAELQAGQTAGALSQAQSTPESALREALIGDIQEKRGDYLHAVKAYQTAASLAPDQERFRIALALELISHQSFQTAIEQLEQATNKFPNSAKLRTLLAIAQYAQGYNDDAVRSLENSIALDPKLDAPYRVLSKIVLQSSVAPAQPVIDRLCSWNQLVCSALQLRSARETSDTALEAKAMAALAHAPPDNPIARCELGRGYEWEGRFTDARHAMEECVRLDPNPQNFYRLGQVYQKLGLRDLAQKQFDRRNQMLRRMSEESALGLNALAGLDLAAK